MLKKIFIFFRILLRCNIFFKIPKKDLAIFDLKTLNSIKTFSNYDFFILETRPHEIKNIYFNLNILNYILKNLFKRKLFTIYLESLILLSGAKLIISKIDNSLKLSEITKRLKKKVNFITIQNASRYEYLQHYEFFTKKIVRENLLNKYDFQNYLVFGKYEKENFKKIGIKVDNFYEIGNIQWSNFIEYQNKKKSITEDKKFFASDICLLAEYSNPGETWHADNAYSAYDKSNLKRSRKEKENRLTENHKTLLNFTLRFCIENSLKLIIPSKRDKKYDGKGYLDEINFFKKYVDKKYTSFFEKSLLTKSRDDYTSYKSIQNSDLVIGFCSTLLKDKIGNNGKILSCNFTNYDFWNFPINGICSLNKCSYEKFSDRINKIRKMSYIEYLNHLDHNPSYVMTKYDHSNNSIHKLDKIINKYLNL